MKVAVVGAGIAGLTAAHHLAEAGHDVVVLDAADHAGGKLHAVPFAGVDLETAADSFVARRPEALELCGQLGLADELVGPSETSAYLFTRGALRRMPTGSVLGVPTDFGSLRRSGVLSPLGAARAALEPYLPGRPITDDVAVGALIRSRYGSQVATRLVDPLVGGINAGHVDQLSIDVSAAQLATVARRDRSLTRSLRATTAAAPTPAPGSAPAPVFLTLPGGLGRLIDALVASVESRGGSVRLATPVRRIAPDDGGYLLDDGSPGGLHADAAVLAGPAWVSARLLSTLAPTTAAVLAAVEHASVAMATMAFPDEAVPRALDASGFVVPRPEGLTMTGCTWADRKWAHLRRSGQVLLRVSAGRVDNDDAALPDDELVRRLRSDLHTTMGITAEPSELRIHRWPRSFPQFAPGHLARIARALDELQADHPRLALAGAALSGVGVPACIGTGRAAAERLQLAAGAMTDTNLTGDGSID